MRPITTRGRDTESLATVLFVVEVDEWQEFVVEHDVDPRAFDPWLTEQARWVGRLPTIRAGRVLEHRIVEGWPNGLGP